MDKGERLMRELWPYAKKAAWATHYKYGIDADDTFQQIMMDAWLKIDKAKEADCPIAFMRRGIPYSVGHCITFRFNRRGNGETDQMEDDYDAAAPSVDRAEIIDLTRRLMDIPQQPRRAFAMRYLAGMTRKEVAEAMEASGTTVGRMEEDALGRLGVAQEKRSRPRRDSNVYYMVNDDGREVRANRKGLSEVVGSPGAVSELINGKKEHYKGWRICS